jgi:hypothetical protein
MLPANRNSNEKPGQRSRGLLIKTLITSAITLMAYLFWNQSNRYTRLTLFFFSSSTILENGGRRVWSCPQLMETRTKSRAILWPK